MINEDPRYLGAKQILENADGKLPVKLYKTTRAGATTGLTANCIDEGLVPLLIAPTKKISHITIKESKDYSQHPNANIEVLLSNHECLLNKKMVAEYPDVGKLPILPLPKKCSACNYFETCPVTSLIRCPSEDVDGIGITYQKLQAIMFSDSETANMIKGRLAACDVVIFDEAHIFESPDTVSIQVYPYKSLKHYQLLFRDNAKIAPFLEAYVKLIHDNEVSIMQLVHEHDDAEKNLMSIPIGDSGEAIDFKGVIAAIKDIIDIMKNRNEYELDVDEVLFIFNIVMMFAADKHILHYIKGEEVGGVYLSTTDSLLPAVRMFKSTLDPSLNKKIIFTTATFGDFDYTRIFGFHECAIMNDVMGSNRLMTIYPDTFKMDNINYRAKNWERILNATEHYETKYPGITFVCMKKNVAWWLQNRMAERGIDINIDYYRSDKMIGVGSDERMCVCVGAPVSPINTYDGVSDTYTESQKKRVGSNHAAFWQAISRFKSPSGSEESQVFCIGITEKEIKNMVKWGIDRKLHLKGLGCDSVDVSEEFDAPNIIDAKVQKCLEIIKNKKSIDRTYLLRYLNLSAAEFNKLILHADIIKHVDIVKQKTKRKPKTVYKWV